MPYLSQNSSERCFMFFPQELFFIFCRYSLTARPMFGHDSWEAATLDSDQEEGLQAALVDPDVTGVMDGCGPAVATTCLFQSPIVWHSVITVYVASQQPVSCVYYPLLTKEKGFIEKKKGGGRMCFLFLSTWTSTKPALLPLSSLSCSAHTAVAAPQAEWEMFGWHGNTFPKWNKCLAAYVLSDSLWSDGTPFSCHRRILGMAGSINPLRNTWFEWVAVNAAEQINTKQCCHLLPINTARFTRSVTARILGFPGFISVKSTTRTVKVTPAHRYLTLSFLQLTAARKRLLSLQRHFAS